MNGLAQTTIIAKQQIKRGLAMKLENKLTYTVLGVFLLALQVCIAAEDGIEIEETEYEYVNIPGSLPLECGELEEGNYGPFDYTNYDHYTEHLPIVNSGHFNRGVETLTKGLSTDFIYGDLDYTLRAFPNHHRALVAVSKFEDVVEGAQEQIDNVGMPVECYFKRGVVFTPRDGMVRLIYATYLHRKGKYEKAISQYSKALEMLPNSAEVHYNLGLYYFDTNNYALSVKHGRKAYALGYPLSGLKDKLIRKGVWDKIVSDTLN